MIKTSTRPERRRHLHNGHMLQRFVAHVGRSKYMPHIGAKQRAKGAARAA